MSFEPETNPVAAEETPAVAPRRLQVPPWMQLVGLPLLVLFGYLFVQAASHAVVVFLIAALISLLLAPVVRALVAFGMPRLVSVLFVFGSFATIVTVFTIVAINVVAAQAGEIRRSVNESGEVAVERIDDLQAFLDRRDVRIDLRDQGVRVVEQLEERSTELSGDALAYGREFVTVVAEAAFNLVLIIVITVYMLLDAPRISRLISSTLPSDSGAEALFGRLERSLLRYTVGQGLASLVMGASATIGLLIMGKTGIWDSADEYAVLFGLIVALTEFAPSIGPVIGSIPPIVVALFDGIGPAIAVTLFFLLLHQIEGHIVIPKLMGAAIAVHPLLVIFGILAGAQIMGIGGILLALPLLAVGRVIIEFVRERIAFGAWPESGPVPAMAGASIYVSGHVGAPADGEDAPSDARPTRARGRSVADRVQALLDRRPRRRDGDDTTEGGA